MTRSRGLRRLAFTLHRHIGLAVGLLLIVVGLISSLLVFQKEIDHFLIARQFRHLTSQQQQVSLYSIVDTIKATYASRPEFKLVAVRLPLEPGMPYEGSLESTGKRLYRSFPSPLHWHNYG